MTQKKFSLFPYLLQYKWHYLAGILILMLVDLANLYVPQFTGELIDGLTEGIIGQEGVWPLLGRIFAAGVVMMLGRFGWRYCIFGAARGIEYRLRNDMFGHLETLSARYFNSHKTGDLMAHFTNDLQALRMAVGPAVVTAFDAIVMTIMVLVKMITREEKEAYATLPFSAQAGCVWEYYVRAVFENGREGRASRTIEIDLC